MRVSTTTVYFMIFLLMSCACTEEHELKLKVSGASTSLFMIIDKLPQEQPSSQVSFTREIFIYDSREDFDARSNEFFHGFGGTGYEGNRTFVNNIQTDTLFVRVISHEIWVPLPTIIGSRSFGYGDAIPVPPFNTEISLTTHIDKWVLEQ